MTAKAMKRPLQCVADPRPFRSWFEHETVSSQPAPALRERTFEKVVPCHQNTAPVHEKVTSQDHQMLPLPR